MRAATPDTRTGQRVHFLPPGVQSVSKDRKKTRSPFTTWIASFSTCQPTTLAP
jgi:hypothetical protein